MRKLPPKFLAAMIAVKGLPGAPLYKGNDNWIMQEALKDLKVYKKVGVDSILLENDFDLPYIKPPLDPKGVSLMTKIAKEVRKEFKGPIGIQMLEGANNTSLEIAVKADLDYIRVEAFILAHIGTSGIIEGSAGELLRLRKKLNAEHIKVFGDIKKKHTSHSLTIDLDIVDELKMAEFNLIDGVIVTGMMTGMKPDVKELTRVKKAAKVPVLIGSGMDPENIKDYLPLADGFIVGSTFRKDGKFLEEIDPERLEKFIKAFEKEREVKS